MTGGLKTIRVRTTLNPTRSYTFNVCRLNAAMVRRNADGANVCLAKPKMAAKKREPRPWPVKSGHIPNPMSSASAPAPIA